ncbi:zinc finger protein 226-like [Topomyia yanbarensis]|uniref:zinc finger protein 226-like n=1 Tax=Topomyia yanbarensis TaxID=2498891 RepID=UPI00273B47A1|nr:zinc finger protein 226-like [Topomyia yanbarensis]
MTFVNCCRLCLEDVPIDDGGTCFCVNETTVYNQLLRTLIEECFGILITDNETVTKVCKNCYGDVQYVYKLRVRIKDTDDAIKQYYSQLDTKQDIEYLELNDKETHDQQSDGKYDMNNKEEGFPKQGIESIMFQEDFSTEIKYEIEAMEEDTGDGMENISILPEMVNKEVAKSPPKTVKLRRKGKGKTKVKNSFTCYICSMDFDTLEELDDHLPSHVGFASLVCNFCQLELTTVRHLNMHLKVTHHTKGKRIPCDECKQIGVAREFSSTYKLQDHIKRVHQGIKEIPELKYVCTYCGKKFSRPFHLKLHENTHTKAIMFQCKYCSKFKTTSRSGLLRHERIHTAEKPFKCDLCDARFAQSNSLQLHKNGVHSNERPFACELCEGDVRFKSKYTLQSHLRIHEKSGKVLRGPRTDPIERPASEPHLKCKFCPAVYYKERFLCSHILDKHPTESVPMIPCELCSEVNKKIFFITQREKDLHLIYHTKIPKTQKKERSCTECGAVYHTPGAMRRHRQSHVVHECKECGKTYKGRAGLRLHYMSVHYESRPYKCDHCEVSYSQFSQLTSHMKSHR